MTADPMRDNLVYQLSQEIHSLGTMMVNFDTWIVQAQHDQKWPAVGELAAQRLRIQRRRSALMLERFGMRHG